MTVYFIKHRNLSPIKIGYTDDLTKRIYSFNNASPYGIDVVGVIETEHAEKLEKEIHDKLQQFRLNGEWFEITEEYANSIIRMYANSEYLSARNEFEMGFIKSRSHDDRIDGKLDFESSPTMYHTEYAFMNQGEISEHTGVNRSDVKRYLDAIGAKGFNRRFGPIVKFGYDIYFKKS